MAQLGTISRFFKRKLKAECLVDEKNEFPLRLPYDKRFVFQKSFHG